MTDTKEVLRYRIANYLDVNGFDLIGLKSNLEDPTNEQYARVFKDHLLRVVEDGTLSRAEYNHLTDEEFETDEEYLAYLKQVWSYLFDNGPHP